MVDHVVGIENFVSNAPSRSSIRSKGPTNWEIVGADVYLNNLHFVGFESLIGANGVSDQFHINGLDGTRFEISGGQGQATDGIYLGSAFSNAVVNSQTGRINDSIRFSGIEQFQSDSNDTSFVGPDRDVTWTVGADATTKLSSGPTVIGFSRLVGGSKKDQFVFLEESNNTFSYLSAPFLDGGSGGDTIHAGGYQTYWYLEGAGTGWFNSNQMANIENLLSTAVYNTVVMADVPSVPWLHSIQGLAGQYNEIIYYGGANRLVVDLQNGTSTGIGGSRTLMCCGRMQPIRS